jgi:hypothetical protein
VDAVATHLQHCRTLSSASSWKYSILHQHSDGNCVGCKSERKTLSRIQILALVWFVRGISMSGLACDSPAALAGHWTFGKLTVLVVNPVGALQRDFTWSGACRYRQMQIQADAAGQPDSETAGTSTLDMTCLDLSYPRATG